MCVMKFLMFIIEKTIKLTWNHIDIDRY